MASRDSAWRAEQLLLGNGCSKCHRQADKSCLRTNTPICSRFTPINAEKLLLAHAMINIQSELMKFVNERVKEQFIETASNTKSLEELTSLITGKTRL